MTLRKHGGTAITLSDAIVNVPGVAATIEETAPGHDFNVILDFPVGFKSEPGTPAELSVKTSHPQFPLVRVPIIQAQ